MENSEDIDPRMETGKAALEREDYMEAFKVLLPCAEEGNAEAQANIGFLYFAGQGIKRDIHEAIKWLKKAADQGRGDAAHNLGTLYLTSEPDIPRNPNESKKWYQRARELGFVVASEDWYKKIR